MTGPADVARLREMTAGDVPNVLDVQQSAAVIGLGEVFPQDEYPFPRDGVTQRWLEEIATPGIECLVVLHGSDVVGFAAVRDDEFLHFGIAVEHWGTGIAQEAHDAVLNRMHARGVQRAWLRVFTDNRRGRRFYEKLGWVQTGKRSHSAFPPYAELLHYERDLTESSGPRDARGMHGHAAGRSNLEPLGHYVPATEAAVWSRWRRVRDNR